MYSSVDKALVAIVMGGISLLSLWTGWTSNFFTEEMVLSIIAVLTPILVYFIPNKKQ